MQEYHCIDKATGQEVILFGYTYSDALTKAGYSREYAYFNLHCYHSEYVD